ncbi:SMC-Scp complex subunit ScpB [Allorhizocola rhizosphaerae]|uniref:SMC-Scp complex subunit ScpB n=1 Tax=Allorhizocola rhizosphaerae TaxID=1872709 RepID=UPI000E3DC45E|nr:SMC-Scp complex subunit ScpB [Allorhizocola rhizosphaerae]
MSDDLAANAATWVPPWQRPASGASSHGSMGDEVDAAEPGASHEPGGAAESDGPERDVTPEVESPTAGGGGVGEAMAAAEEPAGLVGTEAEGDAAATTADADVAESDVAESDVAESAGESAAETRVDADLPRQWVGLAGARWLDTGGAKQADDAGVVVDLPGVVQSGVDAAAGADVAEVVPVPPPARARVRPRSKAGAPEVAGPGVAAGVDAPGGAVALPAQRVSDVDEMPPRQLDESELVPALEAILMVVDEPVSEITLAGVLDVPAEMIANALIDLSAAYTRDGRGFDLRRAAGGWRFYTRADYSSYVEKFVLDGQQMRLTQASLETLAVIAYKQPVSRSRVSAIRGVNCDGVIRTLITRGMIEECGTDPDSGAHLYRTTNLFLEKLGLDSVEQLPPLAPFLPDNLDEVAAGG